MRTSVQRPNGGSGGFDGGRKSFGLQLLGFELGEFFMGHHDQGDAGVIGLIGDVERAVDIEGEEFHQGDADVLEGVDVVVVEEDFERGELVEGWGSGGFVGRGGGCGWRWGDGGGALIGGLVRALVRAGGVGLLVGESWEHGAL